MQKQTSEETTVVEDIVEAVLGNDESNKRRGRPPKSVTKITKDDFADFKCEELIEKGNLSAKQIKALTNSFKVAVADNLSEREYEDIWKKTFYRGSK